MEYVFNDYFPTNKEITIQVNQETIDKIIKFSQKIEKVKPNEFEYSKDSKSLNIRFINGLLGEAAIEQYFGISFIDLTIGDSKKYNYPDIKFFNVGVKTSGYGRFPVIFKNNNYPQIICILDPCVLGLVYICGLATPQILNKYKDNDLLIDPNLKRKGTKAGFYGLNHLIPIQMIKERFDKSESKDFANIINQILEEEKQQDLEIDYERD